MCIKTKILPILLAALVICGCNGRNHGKTADKSVLNDSIPALGFWPDSLRALDAVVRNGQTFSGLLTSLGMSGAEAYSLSIKCDTLFDVKKLRAGNTYTAYFDRDSLNSRLEYLVYNNDRTTQTVFKCADSLALWVYKKPIETQQCIADVTINTSLWNDMLDAGQSPLLISKLSDIYAWTVDFFGLQSGDSFDVIYGQSLCEGDVISIDTIYFAVYTRGDKKLYSVMYDQGDGGNIYWNEKGESMRKAFLKAPLHFNRVSSGFSYHRKHPVTGQVKAHTGVDYAAPTGTPVMSIGDGTVISVGWGGGGGNTVKIRHNSVYTSAYLHLSRYAKGLHSGQRVSQGEVIGYVGATGTATGPHLDFRVWMNGSPINPLKMESPSVEPIKPENLDALYERVSYYMDTLSE